MASILAVGTIALYVYNILMSIIGQGVQRRIRDELYDHMQDLPISYFDRRGRGDIMSVYTNDVDALREMLSRALPMVANSIVTMVACFVMMLLTDLMLTGVVIGVSLLIFFIIIYFTKMASRFFIAQQIELGKMNGYIEEMVNGQRVVKVFNYEKRNIEGFKKHNEQFFNYSVKANRFANLLMPTVNQVGNIQYVLIALIGSLAVFNHLDGVSLMGTFTYGIATVGTIVSFLMYSKAFVQPIGNVSQQLNIIALALAGATRIFEIIDAPAETDDGYVELVNAKEDENGNPVECAERTGKWAWKHPHTDGSPTTYTWLRGKITFNDVDFAYIPGKTVLHNISMYAEEGQKIAFVGPTGSGKTTITNLINRFYDIEDGKVRYDDININKIKKKDLRRSLGVVLQETKLFTGTVMENIRFGNLEATDEEVIAAAKLANAHNFITHLPDGYNTLLHSGGSSLSQGQRQLIAIARAAVANPPVMILDEATSSIDSRTESLVQEGMDAIMKGRTVFVIAHRLSTIKNSDVIMVLQDGRIIERGSHDQLLAEKGKYYQLYTGNEIANK
jgi:ATP-binding cassette subfamily B protein